MSTLLELTNRVLVRLVEPTLMPQDWNNLRGIHRAAVDVVRDTVSKINADQMIWPFNYGTKTDDFIVGQSTAQWESDYRVADWNSFFILRDDDENVNNVHMERTTTDQYRDQLTVIDRDSRVTEKGGGGVPYYVYPTSSGYGVSPLPDRPIRVRYSYYKVAPTLMEADDECTIPHEWEHVIIDGALSLLKAFKENPEIAAFHDRAYRHGISRMRTTLINKEIHVYDTRVPTQTNNKL